MIAPLLNYLIQRPMLDIAFREVTGNNIPHVAIVRNRDEFIDQSISQFGNTIAFFGSGLILDNLLEKASQWTRKPLNEAGKKWFHLGKSLSLFSFIASVNLAMPFLRNYITTKRTGTLDYAEMVGEKVKSQNSAEALKKKQTDYLNRFLKTIGIGAGISASILCLTLAAISQKAKIPAFLTTQRQFFKKNFSYAQILFEEIGLAQGKFQKFRPLAAVLFWVMPTFAGLLAGARDQYEVKELALRFGAFNFAFFIFPITIQKGVEHLVRNLKPTKFFGPSKNLAYIAKLISSTVFCSAVPTVLNIYLTHQRVKRDNAKKNALSPLAQNNHAIIYATPLKRPELFQVFSKTA